jgi:hypothetical protein
MAIKTSDLCSSIRASCDELRGAVVSMQRFLREAGIKPERKQ